MSMPVHSHFQLIALLHQRPDDRLVFYNELFHYIIFQSFSTPLFLYIKYKDNAIEINNATANASKTVDGTTLQTPSQLFITLILHWQCHMYIL